MTARLRGLYAITRPGPDLVSDVAAALRGGARVVQYRDKSDDAELKLEEARQLKALCAAGDALFVVNDDPLLAQASHADGVHLGRGDRTVADVRAMLGPRMLIGVSCYDALYHAHAAVAAGADYLAFGSFYPSPTKPDAPRATLELLRAARAEFNLPLCAIGGITPGNAVSVVEAGADLIAAISGVFDADDIEAAARAYTEVFKRSVRDRRKS